jgi:hypothetical protein
LAGASSSGSAFPLLAIAFGVGVLLLGLAVTPARAVPWGRASRALDGSRDELGVVGGMAIVATALFFLLVQVMS